MSSKFLEAKEVRALLKSELGYNARQVTVREGSSSTYLTITVRDFSVDIKKVKEWAKKHNTWTIDETDYCEGQSIHVEVSPEVNAKIAAPHVEKIKATVERILKAGNDGTAVIEGTKWLVVRDTDAYIWDSETGNRSTLFWAADVRMMSPRTIETLALRFASI